MKSVMGLFAVMLVALPGCQMGPTAPSMTPLEIQAMQTREFDVPKSMAFGAIVSVFQDLGYVVSGADLESGFITANSPSESTTDWFFTGNTYNRSTMTTAFVEVVRPGFTRVRLSFVDARSTSSAYGRNSSQDNQLLDEQLYVNAFDRIDEAIFIRRGVD
jgi:hypothetical protein